jgi:nitrate/nitrite-specific signal transduction histidine kinase
MKARLTISNKLIIGFGVLILITIVNGLVIFSTLNQNKKLNEDILTIYNPSMSGLQELYSQINNSQMLVKNWVFIEKQSETPDKKRLSTIHETQFPSLQTKLKSISANWSQEEQDELNNIFTSINDTLFPKHKYIMESLNNFSSYEDPMIYFEITSMVEEGGSVIEATTKILSQIDKLTTLISKKSEEANIEMANSFLWFKRFVVVSLIFLVVFVVGVGIITTRSITKPVYKLKEFLITMTKGILPKEKLVTQNDEIGDMGDALNGFIEALQRTSEFAVEIGKGNFNTEYESLGEDDTLGNALIDMRTNLKKADAEETKRKLEDEIRNWTTQGLADFGDILRHNSDNMDMLAKNIMKHLVDYLNVNQGAIYILNQQDQGNSYFEMKSAIAYNRDKYLKKNFEITEGLVGRCAFEKLPVYLNEIPEDYIKLTSGLGGAEPNYLLLVPLIINENVLGVIEVASFNEIPKYQIEFIQVLGENIASTISNVRINEQTKHLLDESKLRGDELSAQEEELRQNMEELQATQEEAARREREMHLTIEAINYTLSTIEIDKNGIISSVNENLLHTVRQDVGFFIGKPFVELFAQTQNQRAEFTTVWNSLQMGENVNFIANYIANENEFWFKHSFTPFKGNRGTLEKVIDLMIDVTEQKQLEKELEKSKLEI